MRKEIRQALPKKHPQTQLSKFLSLFIICFILCSCRTTLDHSSDGLDVHHIQTLKTKPLRGEVPAKQAYKKKLASPIPVSMKKIVSVAITEEVPLRDALIEFARQTEVDLQLDSKVDNRIIFVASHRPFLEIIKEICEIAGLRYSVKGKSLRVEVDTPYPAHYSLNFLNLSRTTENRISIATDVFSSIKETNSGADNGSNSSILGKGQNDFWTELDGNLKIILDAHLTSTPSQGKASSYSIHRQGGVVSVYGTSRQHQLVQEYFESLRQGVSTQVLIEAKVVEVALKNQYKNGINWQKLASGFLHLDMGLGDFAQKGRFTDPTTAQRDLLSIGFQGHSFVGLLKAIEEFGVSRTLSSPRLTVMNNQTAILKVAQNQVYFRLNYDKQLNLAGNRESINISSDIQTVPIGLVMSVQPSIDRDEGDIILSLRPTISRLTHSVSDPAVEIAYANAKAQSTFQPKPSLIPVVEVREIDSVLRLKSGEIAVLGGLMETRSTKGTAKMPIAGDIPIIGQLFMGSTDDDEVVELVILLRASIINTGSAPDSADQRLLNDYIDDPRPFGLSS